MSECSSVEVRDLLPELVHDRLDGATRARVLAHVAGCEECAAELEVLRLVRSRFQASPAIDVDRIVSALPRPVATERAPDLRVARAERRAGAARERARRRWSGGWWRLAAAIVVAVLGVGALALIADPERGGQSRIARTTPLDTTATMGADRGAGRDGRDVPDDAPGGAGRSAAAARPVTPPAPPARGDVPAEPRLLALDLAGGVDDLETDELERLLSALDELDSAPVVEPADIQPLSPVRPRSGEEGAR